MSILNNKTFTENEIRNAILMSSTMGGAAKSLKIDWRTFRKEADKYGLYNPGKAKGIKLLLKDILDGKHPQYPTSHLSKRLVKEGLKEYKCESCGIKEWNNKRISLDLDHIDGDNGNHSLNNLRLLCPNCHSQTDTYKSKKLTN